MIQLFKTLLYNPLFNVLVFIMAIIPGHQVGWAIIILTLIIRTLLLPITVHTARVQVRMRQLQPKLDELKKTHKDDKAMQSQATMQLYKEEGVSPFASCLPLIVQTIVLVVMYYVFRSGLTTAHFNLLYSFTPRPDHINTQFFGIDLGKPDKLILPIVAGLTQFWQTKVTIVPSTNPNDPMAGFSKQMVYLAPLMTFVFARGFPAALPLYWAVTNLFSVAQQEYVIKRQGLSPQGITQEIKQVESAVIAESKETKKGGLTVTVRKRD